jgi:hypothetical protein
MNRSTVFAGQALGIKEVEEGIWLVSFMEYDLGYIDLEGKTLQPLDNPFWPKGVNYIFGTFCKGSLRTVHYENWSGRKDLNLRPPGPESTYGSRVNQSKALNRRRIDEQPSPLIGLPFLKFREGDILSKNTFAIPGSKWF